MFFLFLNQREHRAIIFMFPIGIFLQICTKHDSTAYHLFSFKHVIDLLSKGKNNTNKQSNKQKHLHLPSYRVSTNDLYPKLQSLLFF